MDMNSTTKKANSTASPELHDELYDLRRAIFDGEAQEAKEATETAIRLGYSVKSIIEDALFPPMKEIDKKLYKGEVFIPEVLMTSRAMKAALYALQPLISREGNPYQGSVIIGTVEGDLHDLGKDLVAMVLRGKGFSVIDLGIDVAPEVFIEAIKHYHPDILALSAMLTTTLPEMKTVLDAIAEQGLRQQITVMIGGVPATREFAREINADIYTDTLFEAGEAAENLMKHRISPYAV